MDKAFEKYFLLSCCFLLLIFILLFIFLNIKNFKNECFDGTLNNECSETKPYFCENGKLIEKSSICGCPQIENNLKFVVNGDKCIINSENKKIINLTYVLRSKKGNILLEVYPEVLNASLQYQELNSSNLLNNNLKLNLIKNPIQKTFLMPLILQIKNITNNKYDQARIAISLVQNIPYKESTKSVFVSGSLIGYRRIPYEVLYENQGVCGEKSLLLSLLLDELGFNSIIFYFSNQNHEAVGIKCPSESSFANSDYCFIETTGPSIMTDDENNYILGIKLSSNYQIIQLNNKGITFDKNAYEFKDAKVFKDIRKKLKEYGSLNIFESLRLKNLIKKYGLSNIYFIN